MRQNISELKIVSEIILNVLNIGQFCLDIGIYFISHVYDDIDDSNDSQGRRSKGADDCPHPPPEVDTGAKHGQSNEPTVRLSPPVFQTSTVSDSLSRILWINQHS